MLAAWLVFPILLATLSLGVGLLLEAVAGRRLPGELLLPVGFAGLIVGAQATGSFEPTAPLTVPLAVVLALTGLALAARRRRSLRPSVPLALAAVIVGAVYGAPVLASGEPTFAGYIRLDDTATWLALTDRIMDAGRSVEGLPPSSYEATLAFNLEKGYPIGAFLPLGVGSVLSGSDPAWVIQPQMSVVASLLTLTLAALCPPGASIAGPRRERSGWRRAGVAALAAQPALLVAYVQWGGIKEVTAALLVAVAALLAVRLAGQEKRPASPGALRAATPLAVLAAALVSVLSLGGLVWLLVPGALAIALVVVRFGGVEAIRRAVATLGLTTVLSVPALLTGALVPPTSSPLTSDIAKGNLFEPLGVERLAGVWPAGDFRADAVAPQATSVLIALTGAAALVGLVISWRRRAWPVLAYAVGALTACALVLVVGSPWVDAKALATAAPAIPLLALLGAGALLSVARLRFSLFRQRAALAGLAGAVALSAVGVGIVWSNALAHRDASLAPYEQLAELEEIGAMVDGEGPTLMTEYQPYGVRHFLRDAEPEGVSELRRRLIPTRDGRGVAKGLNADTDELSPRALHVYRTLVLRRSPIQSRPPSAYALRWRGRHYEVWQRAADDQRALQRLPLGSALDPVGRLSCDELTELVATNPGATLLAAPSRSTIVVPLDTADLPPGWATGRRTAIPAGEGDVLAQARLPRPTRTWTAWIGGSIRGRIELLVDGRLVGSARHFLNNYGFFVPLGTAELRGGRHAVELRYSGAGLEPGSGGRPQPFGPLILSESDSTESALRRVPPAQARRLCGQRWDWVEAVGRPPRGG